MKDNCGLCKFWVNHETSDSMGGCHRFPPQVIMEVGSAMDHIKSTEMTQWPQTHEHNWCGEFKSALFQPT